MRMASGTGWAVANTSAGFSSTPRALASLAKSVPCQGAGRLSQPWKAVSRGRVVESRQLLPHQPLPHDAFGAVAAGEVLRGTALDHHRRHLGHQRRRHPDGVADAVGDRRARRAGDVADPQARRRSLGHADDVVADLGRIAGQRRRSLRHQEAVDIVLDDGDVVMLRDLRDAPPAVFAHGGGGGILQRRCAIHRLRLMLPAGLLERLGDQAFIVDRHALEIEPHGGRQRLHAGIGQGLRQHPIAGRGQRAEHDGHRMLAAGGDHHALGVHGEIRPRHEGCAGRAMPGDAAMGLILQETRQAVAAGEALQGRGDHRRRLARGREVETQIDRPAARGVRLGNRHAAHGEAGRPHIGTPSHFAADQAAALRLLVGACHRADGDAQAIGEIPVGRQLAALLQLALGDVGRQGIDDREIASARRTSDIGDPNCHGYNVYVDPDCMSSDDDNRKQYRI